MLEKAVQPPGLRMLHREGFFARPAMAVGPHAAVFATGLIQTSAIAFDMC